MKKIIFVILIAIFAISTISAFAEKKTPTIIMGVYTPIYDGDDVKFVTCPEPYDNPCYTCDGEGDGPVNDGGRFYHNPSDASTGIGFTNIDVIYNGNQQELTINAGNQIFTVYQDWLNYFNLNNPIE